MIDEIVGEIIRQCQARVVEVTKPLAAFVARTVGDAISRSVSFAIDRGG